MESPPSRRLDANIPRATTVMRVPERELSEKLSTIGEASVWTIPRQKDERPHDHRVKTPLLSFSTVKPSLNSAVKDFVLSLFLVLKPLRTTRVVETVTKRYICL